ncbi:MAG TPA: DUF222 domain-containing protein [Acidimicrobiia bacterium]
MDWERVSNDEIDEAVDQFSGLVSAGWARVCELIREVDVRQSWMADGARSLTDWVGARLGVRHENAVQLVGVARRLADLPVLASRFASGLLSLDQVDAISRIVTPDSEAALVEDLAGLSNAVLDRRARRHRGLSTEEENSVWERRRLVRQWNLDESELRFRGRLPAAEGRIFDEAIDTRVDGMGTNPETGMFDPLETRSADALVEMAATDGGGNGAPPQVTVFADLDALTTKGWAELDNTAPICNETARRLGCDSVVEWVITRDGQPIGIGRKSRKIPDWLRRLVHHRDGGCCQHPGCGNTRWLQVHHIIPWAQDGPTDLDNLILLCSVHHRWVHEKGWHITGPPQTRVFRRPDWTPHPHPRQPLDPRLTELVSI